MKENKYAWTNSGDKGEMANVLIGMLKVDYTYQRAERDVSVIAEDFKWEAFGALVVMKRSNGDLYVVDGQQRLAAAKQRGDIASVPCVVFESNGIEHEARAFVDLNIHRSPVRAAERFSAAVLSGREPEKTINKWLNDQGYTVAVNANIPTVVDFPAILIRTWLRNEEASKRAVLIQKAIVEGRVPLRSCIHKGLFWLIQNGVDVENHVDKLIESGGQANLLKNIRVECIERDMDRNEITSGRGILRAINARRRNKIRVIRTDDE